MKRAVVIGGNHHNTLGLIRSLGKEGISSFVILINKVQENCYVLKSQYVSGSAIVEGEEDLIELLRRIKISQKKQVLICTSDRAASIIDKNRKVLENDYYLPGCSIEGRLTEYMDKEKMAELAKQVGLRTPYNLTLERNDTNLEGVVYPCIIKPSKSIDGSKMDIAICQNITELQDHIKKCKANNLRVEEFISKTEEYQLIGVAVGGGYNYTR